MKILILGSNTPWVRGLGAGLVDLGVEVEGLNLADIRDVFATRTINGRFREKVRYLPPSYGTRFAWLCGGYLTRCITGRYLDVRDTWLIATNPVFERWTRRIPNDRLVYWKFDDYELYQPARAAEIRNWETALLRRASVVLCASGVLLDRIKIRTGSQALNAHHFPNAVETGWLNRCRDVPLRHNTIGYVGNMSRRVDWELVHEVMCSCPTREFVFVGDTSVDAGAMSEMRRRALALSNATCLGMVQHEDLWRHYSSFEVNWAPYDVRDPFNQACCPTKIFDALATGRPFLSTAVPECLLYPDHIRIFHGAAEISHTLQQLVDSWTNQRAAIQVAYAERNDWRARANTLLDELSKVSRGKSNVVGTVANTRSCPHPIH